MERQTNNKNKKGDSSKQGGQTKKNTDFRNSDLKDDATQCRDEMDSSDYKN